MLLAFKEIQREKLRYSLIIALIALISYMMLVLSALALGLANQNTSAIYGWHAHSIALNEQADGVMRASMLTQDQVNAIKEHTTGQTAEMGFTSTRLISNADTKHSVNFLGSTAQSFMFTNTELSEGRMPQATHELVVDKALAQSAQLTVGQQVTLGSDDTPYTIVGIAQDAKLSVVSVVYGLLSDWHTISPVSPTIAASAVISTSGFTGKNGTITTSGQTTANSAVSTYTIAQFIQLLPGYSAQNATFMLIIAVLAIVTLVIIAVFLYIIVLQKLPNIAVLKAQGIPTRYLIRSTLVQGTSVVTTGLLLGAIATCAIAWFIPESVPMYFSLPVQGITALGLILMGLLGSLLPAMQIRKADPIALIQ